ncbi:hypothetical protein [Lonepinella sp. BR2882]|uniref:hypothetical protein n=1 Tax=Lonepinella sp. BR2882 TaxID=3095283 RepID=UPI003F6DFB0C
MLKNKIKLGLLLSFLFISQNVFSFGCQDWTKISKDQYCTPNGEKLFKYGEVTHEMKNIKSTFRGKTYTYKDLIQPLNYNDLVGIEEFESKLIEFSDELDKKSNNLSIEQFKLLLKVRGDYVQQILDNKFYNYMIISSLTIMDRVIISLFNKFNVSTEVQNKFKADSMEKINTLKIMDKYIKVTVYG